METLVAEHIAAVEEQAVGTAEEQVVEARQEPQEQETAVDTVVVGIAAAVVVVGIAAAVAG